MTRGWIGVDLDGTLATHDGKRSQRIGAPIPAMVERVKMWLREGREVRIVTARAARTSFHIFPTAYRVDSECPMGSVAASIQGPTPYEMLYPSESAR